MINSTTIEILTKILASYSLLLLIVGIILNPLITFVCLKSRKLRAVSTFNFLAIVAINDALSLCIWNVHHFENTFLDLNLPYRSLQYCRIVSFWLQYSTLQYSSWMYMSISLDRYLSLSIAKWSRFYFNGLRPFIYSAILALIIFGLNFNEIFTIGYSDLVNGTVVVNCNANRENQFSWIDLMTQVIFNFKIINISLVFNSISVQNVPEKPIFNFSRSFKIFFFSKFF